VRRALTLILALLALAPAAQAAQPPPNVTSPEAIVVEAQTGDVAYEKDADTPHAIASTTKLMTALLTLEHGGLDDVVTFPRYRAAPAESILGIPRGARVSEQDLLRGLLMYSANDTAVALADHVAGNVPSFVRMMNRRAQQLGLEHTHYANPIGLDDPGNYSTARDLATLARTLRKFKFFRHTVNQETATLDLGGRLRTIDNRNTLLTQHGWVDGVKTGFTSQAGNVLVASGEKRGVHMISVVIGADTKDRSNGDSVNLLNYGFRKYQRRRAVVTGHRVALVRIHNRPGAELPVTAATTVHEVVRKGERFQLVTHLPDEVEGPVRYGERIGRVDIRLRGKLVETVPLTAMLNVPKASAARRIQDVLTRPWILIVLGAILIAVALFTQRRPPRPQEAT
jgi:D-alanyl-D-alanine carboxypeptidase (penicillin-binding protein 5/6)